MDSISQRLKRTAAMLAIAFVLAAVDVAQLRLVEPTPIVLITSGGGVGGGRRRSWRAFHLRRRVQTV